jgi:hypothetical protein
VTTAEAIRDVKARTAALYQYAEAHDTFSEMEQRLTHRGCMLEAAAIHEFAVRVLRAYRAELDDPQPEEPRA